MIYGISVLTAWRKDHCSTCRIHRAYRREETRALCVCCRCLSRYCSCFNRWYVNGKTKIRKLKKRFRNICRVSLEVEVSVQKKFKGEKINRWLLIYYSFVSDRFFVPLLRATDNTLNPVIGAPWAPGTSKYRDASLIPGLMEDPKNPLMTIRAFVGPLNLSKVTPALHRLDYFWHLVCLRLPNRAPSCRQKSFTSCGKHRLVTERDTFITF